MTPERVMMVNRFGQIKFVDMCEPVHRILERVHHFPFREPEHHSTSEAHVESCTFRDTGTRNLQGYRIFMEDPAW